MSISFNTFRNPVQLTTTKTSAAYSAKTTVCKDICLDLESWKKNPKTMIKQCSEEDVLKVCNNTVKYDSYYDYDVCSREFFRNVGKEKSKNMTCKEHNTQCKQNKIKPHSSYHINVPIRLPSANGFINDAACEFFNQEKCKK